MLWRRVHVLRPSASTSGGQSGGTTDSGVDLGREGVVVVGIFESLVRDFQDAAEVHVRQLVMLLD